MVLAAADEDGPDEHRWKYGAPAGTRPNAPLPWGARGPDASRPAGLSTKHAASADAQQHGAPNGPRRHAASFHAPWTDGATFWTSVSPGAHDGTPRHARAPRYAETPRSAEKYGPPRASRYGTQRDAGAPWWHDGPPSSRDGSSGSPTSGGHDAASGEHDGPAGWDDGAPTQDTRQRAKQLWDGQHAGATGRFAWAPRKYASTAWKHAGATR